MCCTCAGEEGERSRKGGHAVSCKCVGRKPAQPCPSSHSSSIPTASVESLQLCNATLRQSNPARATPCVRTTACRRMLAAPVPACAHGACAAPHAEYLDGMIPCEEGPPVPHTWCSHLMQRGAVQAERGTQGGRHACVQAGSATQAGRPHGAEVPYSARRPTRSRSPLHCRPALSESGVRVAACVRSRARACMRACVRARVHACLRVCSYTCAPKRVCMGACVRAHLLPVGLQARNGARD